MNDWGKPFARAETTTPRPKPGRVELVAPGAEPRLGHPQAGREQQGGKGHFAWTLDDALFDSVAVSRDRADPLKRRLLSLFAKSD